MARVVLAIFLAAATAMAENPYASLLEERGVHATRDGIADFLRRSIPTADTPARIARLLRQLAGPDATDREAAVRELSQIPLLANKRVREAMNHRDPEVRRLCRRIVRSHEASRYEEVVHAALQTIRAEPIKGLTKLTLETLPHCHKEYLLRPAREAIVATAEMVDVPVLRAAQASQRSDIRIAATRALVRVRGVQALDDVVPLLKDKDDRVRLAAAEALARLGRRECLAPLAGLLASRASAVRYRAAALLRALTGRSFRYVSYAAQEARDAESAKWRQLIDSEGAHLKLRHPLVLQPRLLGRTLICALHQRKRLEEYDRTGRLTFQSQPLAVPWGCQGLPNGHRLVAVFHARVVIEYDEKGREIWRTGRLPGQPMSVQRLADGNTLVSCSDSGKVVEVNPAGKVVWSITVPGRPIDARRLRNERTLVTLYAGRRVVEVGRRGAILWQLKGANTPSGAQRLPNGNTLVAGLEQHGTVSEYDQAGLVVWRLKGLGTVYEAQRLRNGNTLVATAMGAAEYDPARRVVWRKDVGACRAMRY